MDLLIEYHITYMYDTHRGKGSMCIAVRITYYVFGISK